MTTFCCALSASIVATGVSKRSMSATRTGYDALTVPFNCHCHVSSTLGVQELRPPSVGTLGVLTTAAVPP